MCFHRNTISWRQDAILGQWVCSWVGVYFSPLIVFRVPSSTQKLSSSGKGSRKASAQFLHFQWVLWVLFSAVGPDNQFGQQHGLFGSFYGTPLANSLIKSCYLSIIWCLEMDNCALSSPFFGDLIFIVFIYVCNLEDTTVLGFHMTPEMTLNFSCPFLYSPLILTPFSLPVWFSHSSPCSSSSMAIYTISLS